MNNILFDYLVEVLDNRELKNKVLEKKYRQYSVTYFDIDTNTKIDLMEYVDDKLFEIEFVNQDYLNEDGKKLQAIYDELYRQTK